jgi:hypothetical protein
MARAFREFLSEHRSGVTHDELSDAMQALVTAVVEEGRSGKLVLTISVKPVGKSGALEVGADIKVGEPKPIAGVSIFYATPEGNLIRQDPRQTALELREVPAVVARNLA